MTLIPAGSVVTDLDTSQSGALAAAADLLAQSVPSSIEGMVPYHSAGYSSYLAAALGPPAESRTLMVRALADEGTLVAVADWRILSRTLFLNGLAVAPEFRRRGLGRTLLEDGVGLASGLRLGQLALDVAADNLSATALYRQLGFIDGESAYWHNVASDSRKPHDGVCRATDWPQFHSSLTAYGFGDLTVRRDDGMTTRIRVVGRTMIVESSAANDHGVLRYRGMLDAHRVCVVFARSPGVESTHFAEFRRMSLDI